MADTRSEGAAIAEVDVSGERGWREHTRAGVTLFQAPGRDLADRVFAAATDVDRLRRLVEELRPGFALVVAAPGFVFAAVDKIRSIPLFYASAPGGGLRLSDAPRRLLPDRPTLDEPALLELRMAGYTTGNSTVYREVRQLQAGECLWRTRGGALQRDRYYLYHPTADPGPEGIDRDERLLDELRDHTDTIFRRLVRNAGDRPIWVPLSGGLDSRLVLCKLVEHGARRLQAFSYGPAGNHEAEAAREVAGRLDVPWFHIQPGGREIRSYFESPARRRYWERADGLSVVPSMSETAVLVRLRSEGRLPEDAVMVNGQSGDFITGNHIPEGLVREDATAGDLIDAVLAKHYALWDDLMTAENIAAMRDRIRGVLGEVSDPDSARGPEIASLFELWEWQERQSKHVVNGQRIYDFLGLAWELPLWDEEYLRFWARVPVRARLGQRLYRASLHRYDYRGLFAARPPAYHPRSTPGWSYYPVHAIAKGLGLLGARRASDAFRMCARYIGYYRPQYRAYPLRVFLRRAAAHRNPVSLFADTWIEENVGYGSSAATNRLEPHRQARRGGTGPREL